MEYRDDQVAGPSHSGLPDSDLQVAIPDVIIESSREQLEGGGDEEEEEPITWEVKQVIEERVNEDTGETEFLLEWKNWDGPPTWEPESNCDCKALIRKFRRAAGATPARLAILNRSSQSASQPQPSTSRGANNSGARATRARNGGSRSQSTTPKRRGKPPLTKKTRASTQSTDSDASSIIKPAVRRGASQLLTSSPSSSTTSGTVSLSSGSATNEQPVSQRRQTLRPRRPANPWVASARTQSNVELVEIGSTASSQDDSSDSSSTTVDYDASSNHSEETLDDVKWKETINRRKLCLKEFLGATLDDNGIYLLVKWHGLEKIEKVPLEIMRIFHPQQVIDFLVGNLKWFDKRGPIEGAKLTSSSS